MTYEQWLHAAIVNQAHAAQMLRELQVRRDWADGLMAPEMGAQLFEILCLDETLVCPAAELLAGEAL